MIFLDWKGGLSGPSYIDRCFGSEKKLNAPLPLQKEFLFLENSTITLLIRNFDVLATTVIGFFAVYGVITIFGKKLSINIFRGRAFAQAFCVASLIAFTLEATVFNFPHYMKFFSGKEFYITEIIAGDSITILTSDSTLAELFWGDEDTAKIKTAGDSLMTKAISIESGGAMVTVLGGTSIAKESREKDTAKNSARRPGGIVFKNPDRRITSVYVEPIFDTTADSKDIRIGVTDEGSTYNLPMTVYKGLPFTNHISFNGHGKASELKVYFSGSVSTIAVNRQVPFYFGGLRLLAVSCLFFAVIVFVRKKLRAKITYFLFEYRFDPSSKKQNLIYVFSVILLLLFSWFCAFTSNTKFSREYSPFQQYNQFLVDALLTGRTWLEFGKPEKLLKVERPYDTRWLQNNKDYELGVDWASDWAWYKGKFYCYFGVVPAVILYVPYKIFTDNYLSNHAGIFLFAAIAVVFMALLWRLCVKRYMPNARFAFYLLSFFALFFACGLFGPLRFTLFYSIVSAAGFMFVIVGAYLLLKSTERDKTNFMMLFGACLCFALAVGCRPNLVFASLMVPVFLWKRKSWQLLALVAVPYVLVAIPLCYYNYIRFGSIFDFGFTYNMTNLNTGTHALLDPIGKAINVFIASMSYLFNVNTYSFAFPYVESRWQGDIFNYTVRRFHDKGCGVINFPIVLCLFYFVKSIFAKRKPDTFLMSLTFLIIAAILIFLDSLLVGFSGRYTIDFAIFILIPSIFCAYHLCDEQVCDYRRVFRLKAVYLMLVFSILVGLALFATSITNDATFGDPALYRYLQISLGLPGTV